jgi:hypothetical protein
MQGGLANLSVFKQTYYQAPDGRSVLNSLSPDFIIIHIFWQLEHCETEGDD